MSEQFTDEQIAAMSPGDFRKVVRSAAMVSLLKNVRTDDKGTLSLKVMQGIGEFEQAKQAIVINNFVSRVPADWAQRYVGSSDVPQLTEGEKP